MAVKTTIQATPAAVTSMEEGLLSPNRRKEYCPAMTAMLGMTITLVIKSTQPPIQPALGPMASVTQEKVVPQSGSTRFR